MFRRLARRLLGRSSSAPAPDQPSAAETVEAPLDIPALLASHPVVLFMKGTPARPQCGFSARTVGILASRRVEVHAVDVLASPELREAIKVHAGWPTIPQLYVDGAFVGGCDIVTEMAEDGSLWQLLGVDAELAEIQQTTPEVVAGWLADGLDFEFLDVRTHEEVAMARVKGSQLLTADLLPDLEQLPRDTRIAFLCHHGTRSEAAARAFQSLGFSDLHNVVGGIDAWSQAVDPSIPRY